MNFFQRFTFLFSAPAFDAEDLEGMRVQQIITAIEHMGFQVVKARRLEDAEIAVQTDAAIGCIIVDWGKKGLEGKPAALINLMRKRGLDMPIIILVRRKRFEDIPVEVLDFIDGYVFLAEESPEFIAKNLVSRLRQYAETLKTPFFGALVDYAEEGNRGQGGFAHQPDAQARPRHADRRPDQAQALRGHSGRSARLHRRLCVPGRGDARIYRAEPCLAPQAIR